MSARLDSPAMAAAATRAGGNWRIPFLAFLTVFLDGYDTSAIGFVIPALAKDWQLAPAAFTGSLVMTSVGAVIGYALSGRAAEVMGRRRLLLMSVAWFGLGSCVTALAGSTLMLAILRLLTAVGLGAALPVAVSLAVAHVAAKRRETVTVAVVAGLSVGTVIAGIAASRLIAPYGWPSLFWLGGLLPLVVLWPLLWFNLERDAPLAAAGRASPTSGAEPPANASVSTLLAPATRGRTLALWTFSFFVFIAVYAMTSWIPSLLSVMGFSAVEAPLGGAAYGAGGLLGAVLLVPLSAWIGTRHVLMIAMAGAIALLATIGLVDLGHGGLLACIGGLGACMIAGTIGQSALAVSIYAPDARTSGVGWSAAVGRVGSIVGPAAGGALLAAGIAPRDVVMSACIPVAFSLLGLAVYAWLFRRKA